MNVRRSKRSVFLAAAVAANALIAASSPASAFASNDLRCIQQENVARTSLGSSQSVLAGLRIACPLLGNIIEEFALQDLGEAFPGDSLYPRSREIAVVAAFAALGDTASVTRHARYALDAGATKLEFKELLYLIAVYAGVPRAIEATRALSDLLSERQDQCLDRPGRVELPQF